MNREELLVLHHHVVALEYLLDALKARSTNDKEFWRMQAFAHAVNQWDAMPPDELEHITMLNQTLVAAIVKTHASEEGKGDDPT